MEKVNFFETHVFKYSKRQGTNAAKMEGQIEESEKTRRSGILIDLNRKHKKAYLESFLGKEVEILIEESVELRGNLVKTGHTKEYIKAFVDNEKAQENTIVKARVTEVYQDEMVKCEILD